MPQTLQDPRLRIQKRFKLDTAVGQQRWRATLTDKESGEVFAIVYGKNEDEAIQRCLAHVDSDKQKRIDELEEQLTEQTTELVKARADLKAVSAELAAQGGKKSTATSNNSKKDGDDKK